jgi:hypothetical protein
MTPHDPLTQFLLHELPEAERQTMQERIFFDEGFAEAVEAAERELLDTYARGDLPPDMRQRVESELLYSAEQRLKLDVAKALVSGRPGRLGRSNYRFVALAATLFLVASTAGYISLQLRHKVVVQPATRTQAVQIPSPQPVAAFLLTPGSVRGEHATTIKIPAGAAVRFDLEVSRSYDLKQHSASLYDATGQRIWSGNTAAAAGGFSVNLPGSLFHTGSFRLVLETQPPERYYFVVH